MDLPEITYKMAGWAFWAGVSGLIEEVISCQDCAKKMGSAWKPGLFEDEECACGATLTAFPNGND